MLESLTLAKIALVCVNQESLTLEFHDMPKDKQEPGNSDCWKRVNIDRRGSSTHAWTTWNKITCSTAETACEVSINPSSHLTAVFNETEPIKSGALRESSSTYRKQVAT